MCEVRTKTVQYKLHGEWVATLVSERHTQPAHCADDEYSFVAGNGHTVRLDEEQYRRTRHMFSGFEAEIVRQDADDCWIELEGYDSWEDRGERLPDDSF